MSTTTATDTKMAEAPYPVKISAKSKPDRLPAEVSKPIPHTYSLTHLVATDPNPLPPTSSNSAATNPILHAIARDGAQSLLNTLLLTCPITTTPDGPTISLTSTTAPNQLPFSLPRRLALPKPKAPTKWENFARKKGIGKFGGNATGGAVREERRKNLIYDEEKGEWVKKWGYKGKNKGDENDWLVELDDKKVQKEAGMDDGKVIRGEGRRERMERVRRQERKERANKSNGRKSGG